MYLSELCKIINAFPPHSTDGGIGTDAAYVNMKNYKHMTVIIQQGVGAAGVVTLEKSANGVGAGTAIAFSYRLCDTAYNAAGGDTLAAPVLIVGAGGFTLGATDNSFAVIEVEDTLIGYAFPYARICVTAVAGVIGAIYILSGARYQEPPTALTV